MIACPITYGDLSKDEEKLRSILNARYWHHHELAERILLGGLGLTESHWLTSTAMRIIDHFRKETQRTRATDRYAAIKPIIQRGLEEAYRAGLEDSYFLAGR